MKKNGFTLIELLAVIVILAIIALIATPIILGIINDAREKANERSVELYASAVRNGIASYQLNNASAPTSFDDLDIQYDGNVECATEELYADGSFYITDCTVNGTAVEYVYGEKQENIVYLSDICEPVTIATTGNIPTGDYNPGDEYTCEVKNGVNYTFFVLSKEGNKVNLIMDSNIRLDGTPVKEANPTDKGLVAWLSTTDYPGSDWNAWNDNNEYGPISALNYLKEATKNWLTGDLTIDSFETCDDNGNCTKKQMLSAINMPVRMPSFTEVFDVGCRVWTIECPLWIVNYTQSSSNFENYPNRTVVSGVYGYWTSSSRESMPAQAWPVYSPGNIDDMATIHSDGIKGVRPVITLSI